MLTELQPLHTSSQLYRSNTTPVYFHQLTIVQLTTVPGQVMYNGAKIQMLDLPGIIQGAKDGKGRGRQVIAVAKTCNLIFIVLDVNKPLTDKRVIEAELEGFGIRINKQPPNIHFKKKEKGGISITSTVALTHIDHDEIKAVMSEYRINSADIAIRCDATVDDLIDVLEAKSRSYIPVIYALNKIDAISIEELDLLYRIPNACPISSEHGWNIDELLEQMWEKLNLVRVYTKPKGKMPDYSAPVVLRSTACTIEDFCNPSTRQLWTILSTLLFTESHASINPNVWDCLTSLPTRILSRLSSAS